MAADDIDEGKLWTFKSMLETKLNQAHLFADWTPIEKAPSEEKKKQMSFLKELYQFQDQYPGGVEGYVVRARKLLTDAAKGKSVLSGARIELPPRVLTAPKLISSSSVKTKKEKEEENSKETNKINTASNVDSFASCEDLGMSMLMKKTVFVFVAGGLGERLGFQGVKLSLPVESLSGEVGTTYLEHYLQWIRCSSAGTDANIVLMVSQDTESGIAQLLQSHQSFGMKNITMLKQETVLCLEDNDGKIARVKKSCSGGEKEEDDGRFRLLRKPHGHGDIHTLIFKSPEKLTMKWKEKGMEYIVFLQDTNAAATVTVPVSLALMEAHHLNAAFTVVPRLPKEAVGALCQVTLPVGSSIPPRTMNVEYNMFDGLLKEQSGSGGDEVLPQTAPYSPFPGSINTLLYRMQPYLRALHQNEGHIQEFVNPKYVDKETKTKFKSPVRLESLMQDIILAFDDNDCHDDDDDDDDDTEGEKKREVKQQKLSKIAGILFDRELYHPVKNSIAEAQAKIQVGLEPHCLMSGEAAIYHHCQMKLQAVGVDFSTSSSSFSSSTISSYSLFSFHQIKISPFPAIYFDYAFAPTLQYLKEKVLNSSSSRVQIGASSVVCILAGSPSNAIQIQKLCVMPGSALVIKCQGEGIHVHVQELTVHNAGWEAMEVPNSSQPPVEKVGGDHQQTSTEFVAMVNKARGFKFVARETKILVFDKPGNYVVNDASGHI